MAYITDFSPRPKGFNTPSSRESFDSTAGELLKRAEIVCRHLLPQGRREGNEYKAGDLYGAKGDSLSINVKTGVWKDFATDDGGADLISLWAAVKGVRMIEAKDEAETWLGRAPSPPAPKTTDWTKLAPRVSAEDLKEAGKLPTPDKKWAYVTADGEVWCFVYRTEPRAPGERKRVRPVMPDEKREGKPEGLAPLLNLPDILDQQQATVVLVEGEKCADAISALKMIGIVATTHIGGTAGVAHTDWSPLKDRHVIRWPDKDAAGEKWIQTTAEELRKAGVASVRDVVPDPKWPDKHDAADLETEARRAALDVVLSVVPKPRLALADTHCDDEDWYEGEPPREYLIDNLIPFGRGGLLAAPGGTGKGLLIVDLAAKVASFPRPGFDANPPMAFGQVIKRHGRVMVLSAEDDKHELRRRLRELHPNLPPEVRRRIHFMPYPDLEDRPHYFMVEERGTPKLTQEYLDIEAELRAMKDLVLVIIDPLSSFFSLEMTSSAPARVVGNIIDKLAKTIGCTVLGIHHMTKGDRKAPITSPSEAKHAVQGGAQLVDSLRFAYAIWPPPESSQKEVLKAIGRNEFENSQVFRGAMVKGNYPASNDVVTFARNKTGLLEIVPKNLLKNTELDEAEEIVTSRKPPTLDTVTTILIESVRQFSEAGYPPTKGHISHNPKDRFKGTASGDWFALMPEDWRTKWPASIKTTRPELIEHLVATNKLARTDRYLHIPGDEWSTGVRNMTKDRLKGRPNPVEWQEDKM
jgi:ribosomal protein L36